jgi:hypothetical protein
MDRLGCDSVDVFGVCFDFVEPTLRFRGWDIILASTRGLITPVTYFFRPHGLKQMPKEWPTNCSWSQNQFKEAEELFNDSWNVHYVLPAGTSIHVFLRIIYTRGVAAGVRRRPRYQPMSDVSQQTKGKT